MKIDTRNPLACHPSVVAPYDQSDPSVIAAKAQLTQFTAKLTALREFAAKAKASKLDTPAAQLRRLARYVDNMDPECRRAFDADRAARSALREQIAGTMTKPPRDAAERGTFAAETRQVCRQLQPGERGAFVRQLLKANDAGGAGAILGAPPHLSGLDPAEHALLVDAYRRATAPEAVARLAMLEKVQERLDAAGRCYAAEIEKLVDRKALAEAEAHEAELRKAESAAA